MSIFTTPKTFSFGDELTPGDLNAIASNVANSLNVLTSENFENNPGSALAGGQLASSPDGLTTTQLGIGAVGLPDLAVNATVRTLDVQRGSATVINSGDVSVDLGVLVDVGGVIAGDVVLSLLSLSGTIAHFANPPLNPASLVLDLEMFLGGIAGPRSVFSKNVIDMPDQSAHNPLYAWSAFVVDAFIASQSGDTKIRARMTLTSGSDANWQVRTADGGAGLQVVFS